LEADDHAGSAASRTPVRPLSVETGPERAVHGVVRWRRIDLQRLISERFGVVYHERTVGKILKQLGFSHISARPRRPARDGQTVAAFKNVWPAPFASGF
jgi:transposase